MLGCSTEEPEELGACPVSDDNKEQGTWCMVGWSIILVSRCQIIKTIIRAGHRSSKSYLISQLFKSNPSFFNQSFDNFSPTSVFFFTKPSTISSSPVIFNQSFNIVGSSPLIFNWSFDNVGSSSGPAAISVRYNCGGSMELNARILLLAYMVYL